jgi:uncharacterized protein YecE (DUF72 family)
VKAGSVHIGTSGWNYKHWRNLIYPPKFAQGKWLGFIAERFDTVELNTSFYRIPKPESVDRWQEQTPDHFLFALKLWRGITHYRKLNNSREFIARFLLTADRLVPERRAPILVQLPPSQGKDIPKLQAFVDDWRAEAGDHWRLAFEFRNPSWLSPDVVDALNRNSAALCLHDMANAAPVAIAGTADFVYVRRHGAGEGRYAGSYSPEQLDRDAQAIKDWRDQGKDVFVYFNNDIGGHAFYNAGDLLRKVIG